ncbi:protein AIR1/2 [Microdochium nivale]|nr:protein AIR1/2 [Microdochium nivale]
MEAAEPGAAPSTGETLQKGDPDVASTMPSPVPSHKRPRDLVADLRGLTPSRDEDDSGDEGASPRAKKQRLREATSDAETQSVDDGEVSESDDDDLSDHPDASRSSRSPQSSPRSAGVAQTSAATARATGYNPGINLGVRTSFAARAAAKAAAAKSTPLFGTAASRSPSPDISVHSKEEAAEGEDVDEHQEDYSKEASEATHSTPASTQGKPSAPSATATFNSGGITWTVPTTVPFSVPKNSALRKPAGWRSVLDLWITAFLKENMEHAADADKKVLVTSLDSYINTNISKQKGGKNPVIKARSAVTKMWLGIDEKALGKLVAAALQDAERELEEEASVSSESEGGGVDNDPDQEDGEASELDKDEELRQQHRYYPGAADPSQCCLYCSAVGHKAKECPQRSCRFCSSFKHTSYGCPTKRRCSRCYQLGHGSKSCTEKLALTVEERDPCAFCGAPHLEVECSEIWRSYNPSTVLRKTVSSIPTFCHTCGREGHYGPECGLPGRGPKVAGPTTWSQANRDLYIDPTSDAVAIGWANVGSSSATAVQPTFHIRGHATARRTHTHFVSSDDSDDGFIHEPVRNNSNNNSKQRHSARGGGVSGGGAGSIRISSNIAPRNERDFSPPPPAPGGFSALSSRNHGGGGGGGRQNNNWQPPLPPGPPPPQSSSGYANLPPRPNQNHGHRQGGSGGGGGGNGGDRSNGPPPSRPRGGGGGGGPRSQNRGRGGGGGGGGRGGGRGGREEAEGGDDTKILYIYALHAWK